jgi:hypothetical protein
VTNGGTGGKGLLPFPVTPLEHGDAGGSLTRRPSYTRGVSVVYRFPLVPPLRGAPFRSKVDRKWTAGDFYGGPKRVKPQVGRAGIEPATPCASSKYDDPRDQVR